MNATPEQLKALEIARSLIAAGVPVFAAPPDPGRPGHYKLPKHWEKTVPAPVNLEKWRPGWALAAVGGHAVDFLDVDPRNGGDASLAELERAGHMPLTFGQQETPSGGVHYVISPTGERKSTGFMPGLDLQSGNGDAQGRGFVWIAPTVRASKDPTDAGALKAYRWVKEPEGLGEYGPGTDHSTQGLVDRIHAKRSQMAPSAVERVVVDPDDPFLTASQASATDRRFTLEEAKAWCAPHLLRLRDAPIGMIEETCNVAAATLSHFVPEFWSADQAMGFLQDALRHTAYDPNGPSDWTVDKFWPVLDGRRAPVDNWKAVRRAEGTLATTEPTGASWIPVDVTPVLTGERKRVVPELGQRQDGVPLLYRGKEHAVASEPEAGKTFWVLLQVHHVLQAGGRVVYVDFEDDEGTIVGRLVELGCPPGLLGMETFRYVRPEERPRPEDLEALFTFGPELGPDLVVYDGVTEGLGLLGLEVNSQESAAEWRRLLVKPATRTGAATLSTDHVVKNREARGRFAIGAQHKLAGLTGVMFLMEAEKPHGVGLKGRTRVLISKDRNGGLRQAGRPTDLPGQTHLGDLVSDGTGERTTWTFWPPYEERGQEEGPPADQPPGHIRLTVPKVKAYLLAHPGSSTLTIKSNVEGRAANVDKALAWLASNGLAHEEKGARNARLWSLVDVYEASQGHTVASGQEGDLP